MTPSKPPRTNYTKKSDCTGSGEIQESIYEDPDAVMGAAADGGQTQDQSEVKGKPVPLPRIKSRMMHQVNTTNNNAASDLDKAHSIKAAGSQSRKKSEDNKTPRPVHPPPLPPPVCPPSIPPPVCPPSKMPMKTQYVNSAVATRARNYYSKSIPEINAKPRDPSREKKPPPVPRRPDPSSTSPLYYADRAPSAMSQTSERRTSSIALSPSGPPSEANSYSIRQFPSYLDLIADEPDVTMISPYQADPEYNSIYQLSADDIPQLLTWLKRVCREPDAMAPSMHGLEIEEEISSFHKRAMNVRIARRLYNLLMMKRRDDLQNTIKEFQSICEKLEKVKKTNKNMGIAGGTTGAVGGVTAVVGIALAPMTMGASLIATAVGAGMIASAGGFGAHAVKVNKKSVNRTTVETMVNGYKSDVADIEVCLQFILSAMSELRRYNTARLQTAGAHPDALRMTELSHAVFSNMNYSSGVSPIHQGGGTSGSLLKAFAAEMDEFFTEKNKQKLKKSNKGKFAARVSRLTKGLQEELDYLIKMWEMMC